MRARLLFVALLLSYGLIIWPFTDYLKDRPVEVKLGYVPHPQMLKVTTGEHKTSTASMIILRVLFYFGTVLQEWSEDNPVQPEFMNMYRTLLGVVHLDPYNMDTYYFTQAAFTWELGRIHEVNHVLKMGMEARTWDYWLPFYLGFNYAYFLKDYENAAVYMQRAAELSGNPLFTTLAARYLYESEQTSFGLLFLEGMIAEAKDKAVRHSYEMRRDALLAVISIEESIDAYRAQHGKRPETLAALVPGFLDALPVDPYGGDFYLDENDKVRSTSQFAIVNTEDE